MLYNIDFEIAGVCFLLIYLVFIRIQYPTFRESNTRFMWLVLSVTVTAVLDTITAVTISYSTRIPVWINNVFSVAYFFSIGWCSYRLPEYLRCIWSRDGHRELIDKINFICVAAYGLICLSSPFTHAIFYFDAERKYCHGPLYVLMAIVPFYFLIGSFIRVLRRRSLMTTKQFVATVCFICLGIIGPALQIILFWYTLITYFTYAVAIGILMFAFETPDYKKLIEREKELQDSKSQLESAKTELEETKHLMHELMRSANWYVEVDENGNFVDAQWSPEFKIMLGCDENDTRPDAILWSDALHPDDRERATGEYMAGLAMTAPYDSVYRLMDRSGSYRWYRGSGEAKKDPVNGHTYYKGIVQDINDEKVMEELSEERRKALVALRESQNELSEALKVAENASQAKSRFLSNMSHDIRTPMNAIIGFTDLALENPGDIEHVTECLKNIQSSGEHLLLLINDVLDMSRIESGKLTVEPAECNLVEMMNQMSEMLRSQVKAKKLNYDLDLSGIKDPYVMCDRLRLNQIMINCIGNSIKFTPEGGEITVKVDQSSGGDPKQGVYTFVMTDTGIGMSPEFLEHIFDPFERERSSTISKTQGTGLGMSITKSLVDMMQGTIRVLSTEGEGTKYIITVPFEIVEAGAKAAAVSESEDGVSEEEKLKFLSGRHFLLVDDNKTNRMLAQGVLKSRGMSAEEATDGREAVDRMKMSYYGEFDMVLMDIQMPVMNGYEATEEIRRLPDPRIAGIPVIAMTANAFEEDVEECRRHGMNGHISKPFKAADLVKKLYKVLTESQTGDKLTENR